LKEKREECINNLLNNSQTLTTEDDIELDRSIESNKIVSHLIPQQAQSIGEVVHLVKHDQLDIQKQEAEETQ
jgi:Coiled-coil domain containing 32